ncbi:MAG: TRAP transporter substrate-binding protein DctP, partial [Chloroflexi bacterium]|nr:TRAP transporter substrate-binding protein DctP [Chloroflexota bacterium]
PTTPAPTTAAPTTAAPKPTTAAPTTAAPKPTTAPTTAAPTPTAAIKFPAAGTYKWKFFLPQSGPHWPVEPELKAFTDEVEKATQGALSITWYYLGEHPFSEAEMMQAVKGGYAEMALNETTYAESTEPILGFMALPGTLPLDHIIAGKIWEKVAREGHIKTWDKWNMTPLVPYVYPDCNLHTKDFFVTDFNSLKGKKIRVFSPSSAKAVEALGGIPVRMAFGEVPTGMMTGTIDGLTTEITSALPAGFYDHAKYTTLFPVLRSQNMIATNRDALKKLDEATRNTLMQVEAKYTAQIRAALPGVLAESIETAKTKYGVKFQTPPQSFVDEGVSRIREKVWTDFIQQTGDDGRQLIAYLEKVTAETK